MRVMSKEKKIYLLLTMFAFAMFAKSALEISLVNVCQVLLNWDM
jgi:hypothetical protein